MSAIPFALEGVEIAKKGWRVPKLRFFIRKDTSDQKSLDETIRKNTYLKKGVTVELGERWLDLGSNIGGFTCLAYAKGAREVISVEAEAQCYEMTSRNVKLNGFRFNGVPYAASLNPGKTKFYVFNSNRPKAQRRHSMTQPLKDFTVVEVNCMSVRQLVKTYKPDGMKVNIEGEEIAVMLHDPEAFRGVKKIAMEYSFDKDKRTSTYRQCLKNMSRDFTIVEARKVPPELELFDFYPPNQFIYLLAKG